MNASMQDFAKRIPAYLDGMMDAEERLQFEAFVGTNPEFAGLFRQKQSEQEFLKKRVPEIEMSGEIQERLETEVREVIENLFQDEGSTPATRVKSWFKELF